MILLTILASLASGAIGAFLVYRYGLPKVEAKIKVSISAELSSWERAADEWITSAIEQAKNEALIKVATETDSRFSRVEKNLKNQADAYTKGTAERLRKAFDERATTLKTELEAFVQTELGAAIVQLTDVAEPEQKLEGVTPDKPKTETDEEKKSRGVEGTFCM